MVTISPRLSLPAAHEYVRAPADMHPRLVELTSPNITNTGLNSREPQASAWHQDIHHGNVSPLTLPGVHAQTAPVAAPPWAEPGANRWEPHIPDTLPRMFRAGRRRNARRRLAST